MAIVLQDTHLFTGTVRENIRFGMATSPCTCCNAIASEVSGASGVSSMTSKIRSAPAIAAWILL